MPKKTTAICSRTKLFKFLALISVLLLSSCGNEKPKSKSYSSESYASSNDLDAGPMTTTAAIRTTNREYVNQCASKLAEGATLRIDRYSRHTCRKPFLAHRNRNNYLLSKIAGKLSIGYNIRFDFDRGKVGAMQAWKWLQEARSCLNEIRGVWARYEIFFHLTMDSNLHPEPALLPSVKVKLIVGAGRTRSSEFYTEVPDFCAMILHESGHHLGLSDEYAESACPDREFISEEMDPYSIMADKTVAWENFDFYPRHLETVLGDFCSGRPASRVRRVILF